MKGSRPLDEIIRDARNLCYQESFSYTEGWDTNTVVEIANLSLDRIYGAVTQIDSPANIEEVSLDVFATVFEYDLPIDVHMALRLDDVRYLFGPQPYQFVTLRQGTISDRFQYPTNIPDTFAIRNGKILLSPTPNITRERSLVINYQKRMRKQDVRRGYVTSIFQSTPYIFQLGFTPTSRKDIDMQANADSLLDLIYWCCLVDPFGEPIMNAIPLLKYDINTKRLYADPSFVPDPDELAALNAAILAGTKVYVVQGDYSSTHSQLDRQCEDAFIEYLVLRLLRLSSNVEATPVQMKAEQDVIDRLINQYRRVRPSVYPIQFQTTSGPRSFPFGRRGLY